MAKIRTIPTKILNQRLTSTGTKLYLDSITDWDGVALTSSTVPALMYVTLRNSNRTQLEVIEVDGTTIAEAITSTGATINKRALGYEGGTTTATETAYEWNDNETYVELCSDTPQILDNMVDKDRAQTITGIKTFSASPIVPTPTTDYQTATKKYADELAIAGAADMSLTVKGIGEEATAAEIDAGTQAGGTSAELVVNPKYLKDSIYYTQLPTADQKAALASTTTPSASNKYLTQSDLQKDAELYAADAEASDTYEITVSPAIAAYATGMTFRVKFNTANTGAATLNVSALGAKAITKAGATALATGDILADQVATLVYDGTQFQIQGVNTYEAEMAAVFAATDITGAELETLSAGTTSNADTLHTHSVMAPNALQKVFVGSQNDGFITGGDGTEVITRNVVASKITNDGQSGSSAYLYGVVYTHTGTIGGGWGKASEFQVTAKAPATATIEWKLSVENTFDVTGAANGVEVEKNYGFRADGAVLYASTGDGSEQTLTDISAGITLTNFNTYRAVFTPTTNVKFYINGILVATHTTNLPATNDADIGFGFGHDSSSTVRSLVVNNNYIYAETI